MAQFDVHKNIGKHKEAIPFVLIVQSSQFDSYRRRVVVPLVRANQVGPQAFAAFNPAFTIRGVKVVLHPLEIVSIPLDQLGKRAGSLVAHAQEIIGALDELITRAWK
jgi:toxin CcdB